MCSNIRAVLIFWLCLRAAHDSSQRERGSVDQENCCLRLHTDLLLREVKDSTTDTCLQCKQPSLCVQCRQSLEIRTVNLWLFIFLCNLCFVSLCAVQFCTCTVKVNIKAYRNWTSWYTTILIYIFDTINCPHGCRDSTAITSLSVCPCQDQNRDCKLEKFGW